MEFSRNPLWFSTMMRSLKKFLRCILSENVSVSTSVTEKRENNENVNEVRQSASVRLKNRSFSGEVKKEKTVEKTPRSGSDPSPGRARSGHVIRKNGPIVHGRKDSEEGSCRRSMSLVTRTHGWPAKIGNALDEKATSNAHCAAFYHTQQTLRKHEA
ncbi:Uncharacterized protein Fot_16085 [Forsythia ovata]|uniref:Uncharacterized protein n=1 Tax=Forsythia ovata TaxID=205694 RepID=A0ABD1WB11_9LAMI